MKKEVTFNKIVAENADRIKRICRYYNSNLHDQEDMFQEVLVNIWKSLENFRGESAISTWIYRIAVNTSLSFNGNNYKQMELIVDANNQNLNTVLDEESLYSSKIEEDKFNRLQAELNVLSVIDKALMSLMLEGLTMKEIANVIGITESNVKVKIHRIKEQLKNRLGGCYDEK